MGASRKFSQKRRSYVSFLPFDQLVLWLIIVVIEVIRAVVAEGHILEMAGSYSVNSGFDLILPWPPVAECNRVIVTG